MRERVEREGGLSLYTLLWMRIASIISMSDTASPTAWLASWDMACRRPAALRDVSDSLVDVNWESMKKWKKMVSQMSGEREREREREIAHRFGRSQESLQFPHMPILGSPPAVPGPPSGGCVRKTETQQRWPNCL